jgi:hypothetical protein
VQRGLPHDLTKQDKVRRVRMAELALGTQKHGMLSLLVALLNEPVSVVKMAAFRL